MSIATNRKAVVTGGASGFGLAVARRLIGAGASVGVLDLEGARLRDAVGELGTNALSLPCDVSSSSGVRAAMEQAVERFGGLDTLVLSAGVIHIKPYSEVDESDWDLTLDVNLKGAFLAVQASAAYIGQSGRGRIVAISSDAGKRGFPLTQAYCASKFGLIGLMESFAVELAGEATTVNCVCPVGVPTTGMGQKVLEWKVGHVGRPASDIVAAAARTNPLGRNATEVDIANAVMHFVSDEAAFLTGVALDVDGGAHIGGLPGVS